MKELLEIQTELKAPKNQFNSFGKYKYRSCEDILEALKPLLKAHGVVMVISDTMVNLGDRYYIQATVTLSKDGESIQSTALARESMSKKGMDESQITGTASSYARKYALNGLFLIDDTKDADTMDNSQLNQVKPMSDKQRLSLEAYAKTYPDKADFINAQIKKGISDIKAQEIINRCKA